MAVGVVAVRRRLVPRVADEVGPPLGPSYSVTVPSGHFVSTSPPSLTPRGHVSSKWRSATRKKNPAALNVSQILKPLTTRSVGHIEPASQLPARPLATSTRCATGEASRELGWQLDSRRVPAVTFLCDYGLDDDFVGVCHGVIARIAPDARVIDISHGIARHDVRAGALVLRRALATCPPACTSRSSIPASARRGARSRCARGEDRLLVGPDNGLLSLAAQHFGGVAELSTSRLAAGSSRSRRPSTAATSSPPSPPPRRGRRPSRGGRGPARRRRGPGGSTCPLAEESRRRPYGAREDRLRPLRERHARRRARGADLRRPAPSLALRSASTDWRRLTLVTFADVFPRGRPPALPGQRTGRSRWRSTAARPARALGLALDEPAAHHRPPKTGRRARHAAPAPARDGLDERAGPCARRRGRAARDARHRRGAARRPRAPGPDVESRLPGRALLASLVSARRAAAARAGQRAARSPTSPGADARIKWPNDVLVDGRKVAGILAEGRPQEGWAVLGIGVNVAVRAGGPARRSSPGAPPASDSSRPRSSPRSPSLLTALEHRLGAGRRGDARRLPRARRAARARGPLGPRRRRRRGHRRRRPAARRAAPDGAVARHSTPARSISSCPPDDSRLF